MACTVKYDKNNKIQSVLTPQGKVSQLFKSIAKLPHMNSLEDALEVYKNIYTAKYYSLIGERGAQNKPEFLKKLDEAKQLENSGQNLFEIEKKTGWFKENNQWKFLDIEALKNFKLNEDSVNITEPQKLKNVIENETLFETFPFLAESEIQFREDLPIKTATFNPKTNAIGVGISTSRFEGEDNIPRKRLDFITSSIVHEIQHYIQFYEGFPVGGNLQTVIREQAKKIGVPEFTDPNVFVSAANSYLKNSKDKDVEDALNAVLEHVLTNNKEGLIELYARIFGEVEARLMEDLRDKLLKGESFEGTTYSELKASMLEREEYDRQNDLFVIQAEPTLNFKSDRGNTFGTFKEALMDSSGKDIEISIGELPVVSVSSNTNVKKVGGFINNNIKAGILSDERIIDQGESFLKAEGYDEARQIVNEVYLREDAIYNLGGGSIRIHKDGRIELNNELELVDIGGTKFKKDDVRKLSFPQLEKVLPKDEAVTASIHNVVRDSLEKQTRVEKVLPENTLKLKLLDVLNKMGVKVLSISDYIESYKIRNGVDPSAEALADIANQVVAFKDGEIPVELLSEETSHFIVEAWDKIEIEGLLRNINKTESYTEFSEQYREIYSRENPTWATEQIEELVRKEILGKELAKALQTGFNTENKTEIQRNILQKIYDLFVKFFQNVALATSNNEAFYRDLETLTSKVEDLLISEDIDKYINVEQLKNKKFKMYSAKSGNVSIDAIRDLAQKSAMFLLEQERALRKAKKGSQANVEQLRDIDKKLGDVSIQMEDAILAKSISDIVALAHRQAKYIEEAITTANKKGETLTNEESIVLSLLQNQTAPALARMQDMIRNSDNKIFSRLDESIKNVNAEILRVRGRSDNTKNDILERIVDRLMKRHSLPEKTAERDVRQELLNSLETAEKDTNMLFAMYGQITHARDPLLNMLGSVIGDIFTNSEQRHLNRVKPLQKWMRDNGVVAKDAKDFVKGKWMLSLWDWKAYEENEAKIKADVLYENSDKSRTKEELLDKEIFTEVMKSLTAEQNSKYQTQTADRLREERENAFNDNYYKEREEQLDKLNISEVTRIELRKLSRNRGEIVANATMENGKPRYSLADKYSLDAMNIKRRSMKSIFDVDGTLKIGVTQDVNGAIEVEGVTYSLQSGASEEAKIAFDMQKIDAEFIKKQGVSDVEEGIAKSFEDELANIVDEEEAREFLLMNTNIGFSSTFWDSFDKNQSFINRAESFVVGNDALEEKLNQYKEKVQKRNSILKIYKDNRNLTNTLVESMPDEIKDRIISLSEDIDELSRYFSSQKTFPKSESEIEAESTPNEAYYGALNDANLNTDEEKLKYAMTHMTSSNLKKVRDFNDIMNSLVKGRVLTPNEQKIIERVTGENIDINRASEYKLKNAENKLASYYRAFAPTGLSEAMRQLNSGEKTALETLKTLKNNSDIKLSNNYSYYEKSEVEGRNKNKIDNFAGGYVQPKLYDTNGNAKYINQKFVNLFAPKTENGKIVFDENGDIIPTINQKKYEFYKVIMDYHKDSLDSYNEKGVHNAFLAPQVSKQMFESISDVASKRNKGAAAKEWWRDISQFRADELATGAEVNGESLYKSLDIKVIPKYFMNRLEDDEAVSQDLFYTVTAFAQQAELYKSRLEKFHEVSVLQDAMLARKYPEGKKAETTSTYKMFQNYMNGAIFGIREIKEARVNLPFFGEVNITKIIDNLHKFLRHRALAINVIIPATSWLTAEATLLVEKYVGQYVDKDSYMRARIELRKLRLGAFKETLEIDSRSKMAVMGEYFGIFDLDTKFKNSTYSAGTRMFARAPYILHTAANFEPISKALLSGLYGNRLYNGQFLDFNQFKALQIKSGKPLKTIKSDWSSLENKTLYNYIAIDEATNTMSYNYEQIAKDSGVAFDESFKEDFRNRELAVTAKIKKLVELIDGQVRPEEKSLLARDILGRFVMTHAGWMAISLSRRFKSRHYSLQTGIEEEGTYVSLGKFLTRAFGGMTKDNIKSFKRAWDSADETEKDNLRRIIKEVAFLQGIFLLGLGYGAFADDDDMKDIYAIQATNYLLDRTINETSSAQFGLTGELYQKMKSPITGLSNLKDLLSVKKAFDFSEVETGSYKGMTNSQAYFTKVVPGIKSFVQFKNSENLREAKNTYDLYNDQKDFIFANYFLSEDMLK